LRRPAQPSGRLPKHQRIVQNGLALRVEAPGATKVERRAGDRQDLARRDLPVARRQIKIGLTCSACASIVPPPSRFQ